MTIDSEYRYTHMCGHTHTYAYIHTQNHQHVHKISTCGCTPCMRYMHMSHALSTVVADLVDQQVKPLIMFESVAISSCNRQTTSLCQAMMVSISLILHRQLLLWISLRNLLLGECLHGFCYNCVWLTLSNVQRMAYWVMASNLIGPNNLQEMACMGTTV